MTATALDNTRVSPGLPLTGGDPFQSGVMLRLSAPIEDLGRHGRGPVARLREALAAGVPFVKDRKRPRFYEVRLPGERFYIHVLRGASKVLLVARWDDAAKAL